MDNLCKKPNIVILDMNSVSSRWDNLCPWKSSVSLFKDWHILNRNVLYNSPSLNQEIDMHFQWSCTLLLWFLHIVNYWTSQYSMWRLSEDPLFDMIRYHIITCHNGSFNNVVQCCSMRLIRATHWDSKSQLRAWVRMSGLFVLMLQ